GDKKYQTEAELLERILSRLAEEKPVRGMTFSEEESEYVKGLFLLTSKPVIYAANISEMDMGKDEDDIPRVKKVREYAENEGSEVLVICAKTEEELSQLPEDEAAVFIEELGLSESGLNRLVKASYKLLGLISYLTAGEKETRAWTIENGTKAPQAAGKIHSDFEKGFIRAEVVDWQTLLECGSYNAAKEKGKVRSEGKDYVFKDGDVVLFRFNV
ncbi:MAG: redox-regulated ATPase YchF, partial [Clostridia bacterium]|nr:redox-regulated ATPase YchF [Clostridia bacterium]